MLYSFNISVCKLCLTLNKNKKDASFKHHGHTTSQTRQIKIHHPNHRIYVIPTKPKRSQIVVNDQKRRYRDLPIMYNKLNVPGHIKFFFFLKIDRQ